MSLLVCAVAKIVLLKGTVSDSDVKKIEGY